MENEQNIAQSATQDANSSTADTSTSDVAPNDISKRRVRWFGLIVGVISLLTSSNLVISYISDLTGFKWWYFNISFPELSFIAVLLVLGICLVFAAIVKGIKGKG